VLVTLHHIVGDAWSLGLFTEEWAALQEAFTRGIAPALPELPIQYADYAIWERARLDEVLSSQLPYWREALAGRPPPLRLPSDRPRPALQSFRGGYQIHPIPGALYEAVAALGREAGVTAFTALFAAFAALLYRLTGQEDILVGTGVASRRHVETERLIGCFINLLALRVDLSQGPSFRDLLGRAHRAVQGAFAHQDVPFEKVVEAVQPEREGNQTPLVQVAFGLDNGPKQARALEGVTRSFIAFDYESVRFDLTLWVVERPDGAHALWTYSSDLFDPPAVARMAQRYASLLEDAIARPDAPIDALELTTPEERAGARARAARRDEENRRRLLGARPRGIRPEDKER
jgi:hypothetical protein